MIRVAICDDEKMIAGEIENIISGICDSEKIPVDIDVFSSGESLEEAVEKGGQYDLLYLDIQMKGENGITAARNIRKKDEDMLIVFISGYDRYLMELFRLDVFDFIKKPIVREAFVDTFLAAGKKISNRNRYFPFRYKCEEHKVPYKEILYFESRGRKVSINLRNGNVDYFYGKLSDLETKLAESKTPFLRIHQSYLVNYHQIESRSKIEVRLVNGENLPISEDKQKEFGKRYVKLMGGEVGD